MLVNPEVSIILVGSLSLLQWIFLGIKPGYPALQADSLPTEL